MIILQTRFQTNFWRDILVNWKRVLQSVLNNAEPHSLTCPLWYNPNISKETLFLSQWYRVGIIYPANLYNSEGNLLTLEEVRNTFGTNLNFLDYNRIRLGIEKFKNKNDAGFQTKLPEKPIWPKTISL